MRRGFQYLCTLDNMEAVKGIENTINIGPRSKEEKTAREVETLLFGVEPADRDKVLRHLKRLRSETDPLEGSEQVPNDCIMSTKIDEIPAKSE